MFLLFFRLLLPHVPPHVQASAFSCSSSMSLLLLLPVSLLSESCFLLFLMLLPHVPPFVQNPAFSCSSPVFGAAFSCSSSCSLLLILPVSLRVQSPALSVPSPLVLDATSSWSFSCSESHFLLFLQFSIGAGFFCSSSSSETCFLLFLLLFRVLLSSVPPLVLRRCFLLFFLLSLVLLPPVAPLVQGPAFSCSYSCP